MRSLRLTKQTLVGGMLLLLCLLLWQGYGAWQAVNTKSTGLPLALPGVADETPVLMLLPAIVLIVLLSDLILSWPFPNITLKRRVARSLSLDAWTKIELALINPQNRTLELEIFDFLPDHCDSDSLPLTISAIPGNEHVISYNCCPRRRGPLRISCCAVRISQLITGRWLASGVKHKITAALV